ncbi:MATE family efflux transporter [Lactococcus termiticola]|uniref:Probable multidrug resistance protein NorM n=1 Tax=Lactococcus termiticola TaxID=2169526 RepID=A0A2R5HKH4_9LACT|nr:MATE family efflux transporter [Lactococcus termiticola]GBG97338.1 MATE family efflux transporter [Lactococcus termiticola]
MASTKSILKFALPAVVENFLQMLMTLMDTFLVARISLSAVAGVALAGNILTVYQAVFVAIGTVISSLLARAWAREKETGEATGLLASSQKLIWLVGIFLGLISIIGARAMTTLLGARGTMAGEARVYLMLVGGFMLFLALMTVYGAFLRASGDTKTPMMASFYANGLNIIFAGLFIFGLHWGVIGAGLGTVLARAIGAFFLYNKCRSAQIDVSFHFWKQKISRELLHLSGPATAERLVMRFGDLIVIALIISFGAKIYAGNAIGENITQFNYMPGFGMATATVILGASAFGQQDPEGLKAIVRKSYWLTALMMVLVGAVILLASDALGRLFTKDAVALSANHTVILFSLLATIFTAGTLIYTAAHQSVGNTRLPFLATSVGMLIVRVVLGFVFGHLLGLGLEGVWLAVIADNLFRFIFLKWRFQKALK